MRLPHSGTKHRHPADVSKPERRIHHLLFSFTPKDEDDLTPRTRENVTLDELRESYMAKMGGDCVFISAKEQINALVRAPTHSMSTPLSSAFTT